MPDQSERDDDLSSDATGTPVEQDSDESEIDDEEEKEGDFFDLEAEESDDYEDENGNEADDDYGHRSEHCYFPQFSRLPPELRAMIWEALDPDLKSKARVLDFIVIKKALRDGDFDIWESATLAQQTAPARAVLATCRESRCIALGYYPDTIQLRRGVGEIRFNSANDIILLRLPQDLRVSDLNGLGRLCSKIKYLAFNNGLESYPTPRHLPALNDPPQGLEAIFSCFDARTFGHRLLDWSVSESSKQFYVETFEEQSGLGEDIKALYCWPDTTLHADFLKLPEMPAFGSIPVWLMAQYLFDDGLVLYQKAKRHYERNLGRENGSRSPLESSEGESFYESEPDDYVRDGFIVDSSSEESEETSDDEDDRLDVNGLRSSSDHGDSDQELDDFNGFSPLQNSSDDEATSSLRNVTSVVHDVSFEEQPRAANQSSRRKRRIVSSEDESDDDDDVVVKVHSRVTSKRARFITSDSEGDEDGSGIDAGPGVEGSSRLRKRARIILSDSEDDEDDKHTHNEGHQLSEHSLHGNEDDDDDEDGGTEEEEYSDEEDEDLRASKPVSLLARLRQFRSDVPVSPEGESTSSSQEQDEEERYEDEDGQRISDDEFPESPDEEGDQDGW